MYTNISNICIPTHVDPTELADGKECDANVSFMVLNKIKRWCRDDILILMLKIMSQMLRNSTCCKVEFWKTQFYSCNLMQNVWLLLLLKNSLLFQTIYNKKSSSCESFHSPYDLALRIICQFQGHPRWPLLKSIDETIA